ncbi:hypothetical protein D7Z54_33405 [Salibacterium salarium]|uniref:Sulfotransferase domain-containing protein n=1 Tax=Salibacterium salarium TaxID=284579 RepID=A0A3R9PEH4_9BACI|nr:sulfotransferase domain-containing protein [Salibacterium salarium]RSL29028.1 hypothetical protein D7Z54_33405 [Salibacterium salarium]
MVCINRDLIVTGIPRGGTTLTAALVDSLSNSICLSEPDWQVYWLRKTTNPNEITNLLTQDYVNLRKKVINKMPIEDRRRPDGSTPTNYYSNDKKGKRIRGHGFSKQPTVFDMKNKDFLLGIKHCTLYSVILPHLIKTNKFSILAVTRHPVPTLLSWNSVNKFCKNKVQLVESHWPDLKKIIHSRDHKFNKQARIYDLYCRQYLQHQKDIQLIKYEDLVKKPSILENITDRKLERTVEIKKSTTNVNYDYSKVNDIKESLYKHAPHALKLYSLNEF